MTTDKMKDILYGDLNEFRNPFSGARIVSVDTDNAAYRRNAARGAVDFVMSRSDLVDFLRSPRKWIHSSDDGKDTDATEFGALVDLIALQPRQVNDRVAVTPESYEDDDEELKPWTRRSKICREWEATERARGRMVVSRSEFAEAQKARLNLIDDESILELVVKSQKQVMLTAFYHDALTMADVPVKVLIDLVPDAADKVYGRCLADLKTARNGQYDAWDTVIFDRSYDVQAALYLDVFNAVSQSDQRLDFRHIVVENEPPYETGKRILSQEWIERGRTVYLRALKLYAWCITHDKWPGSDEFANLKWLGWPICGPKAWHLSAIPERPADRLSEEPKQPADEKPDFVP